MPRRCARGNSSTWLRRTRAGKSSTAPRTSTSTPSCWAPYRAIRAPSARRSSPTRGRRASGGRTSRPRPRERRRDACGRLQAGVAVAGERQRGRGVDLRQRRHGPPFQVETGWDDPDVQWRRRAAAGPLCSDRTTVVPRPGAAGRVVGHVPGQRVTIGGPCRADGAGPATAGTGSAAPRGEDEVDQVGVVCRRSPWTATWPRTPRWAGHGGSGPGCVRWGPAPRGPCGPPPEPQHLVVSSPRARVRARPGSAPGMPSGGREVSGGIRGGRSRWPL